MLETLGVPVVGYRTDTLPAFVVRDSGLPLSARIDSPEEAARLFEVHAALTPPTGMILAQPVGGDVALAGEEFEAAVRTAGEDAERRGICGGALTPFLLDRMREITGGESVRVNVALLRHNAAIAAALAVAGV